MYASGERVRVHLDGVPDLATVRAAVPSGDTSGTVARPRSLTRTASSL
jgi:hypothetical protein